MLAMQGPSRGSPGIAELLSRASRVAVVTHRNADPDALGALVGILSLCRSLGVECTCMLPEGISAAAKRLVEALGADLPCAEDAGERYDLAVVVDVSSPEQMGVFSRLVEDTPYILVDHHSANQLVEGAALTLYDPEAPSSSELVALALEELGVGLEAWEAGLMLGGIAYDTRRFLRARHGTFRAAAYLAAQGADYREVLSALQRRVEEDYSEKVAKLKAASRSRVFAANGLLVVVTHVGAFESSAARALLELGADVAIVVSEQKAGVRVSGRAKASATSRGVRLGAFMERLAEALGGTGGGHDAAAGATGSVGLEEALRLVVEALSRYLGELGLSLQELD